METERRLVRQIEQSCFQRQSIKHPLDRREHEKKKDPKRGMVKHGLNRIQGNCQTDTY